MSASTLELEPSAQRVTPEGHNHANSDSLHSNMNLAIENCHLLVFSIHMYMYRCISQTGCSHCTLCCIYVYGRIPHAVLNSRLRITESVCRTLCLMIICRHIHAQERDIRNTVLYARSRFGSNCIIRTRTC